MARSRLQSSIKGERDKKLTFLLAHLAVKYVTFSNFQAKFVGNPRVCESLELKLI